MKKLEIFNSAFYSNSRIKEASIFSMFLTLVLFVGVVLVLGLTSSYQYNQSIEQLYINNQIKIESTLVNAIENFDECLVDEDSKFICNSKIKTHLDEGVLIYNNEDYLEGQTTIGFFEESLLISVGDFIVQTPYTFSIEYDSLLSKDEIANIHVLSAIDNATMNKLYSEFSYSLMLLTVNTLFLVSVNAIRLRKIDKLLYNRRNLFKQFVLIAIATSIMISILSVLFSSSISVLVPFALAYNLRIVFYLKELVNSKKS